MPFLVSLVRFPVLPSRAYCSWAVARLLRAAAGPVTFSRRSAARFSFAPPTAWARSSSCAVLAPAYFEWKYLCHGKYLLKPSGILVSNFRFYSFFTFLEKIHLQFGGGVCLF